jgi:hypothetical protein
MSKAEYGSKLVRSPLRADVTPPIVHGPAHGGVRYDPRRMSELQGGEGAVLSVARPAGEGASEPGLLLSDEQRRRTRLWLSVLGAVAMCSVTGTAFSMYLVKHQPLLLIALSPLARHLLLVAHRVDPLAFIALGTLRRFVFYVPFFELSRDLGAPALELLDRRMRGLRPYIGFLQRVFAFAPHVFVLISPGPVMATLAGSGGVRRGAYVPLVLVGLCLRLWIWLVIAEWAREPIEALLAWIDRYWVPGTVLLVTALVLYHWRQRRRSAADTRA